MERVEPLWLKVDFIKSIIKNDLSITSEIHELHYHCERAVDNGENYSSELFRLYVCFVVENSTHNKRYIVKQMLDPNTDVGKNLVSLNIFEKEFTMYTETLVNIGKIINSVGYSPIIGPRLVHWCKEPIKLLVLEDLIAAGFSAPDRRRGLDHKQCELALKKLAQLHAASMVLNKKNAEYRNIYNKGGFFENMPSFLSDYYITGVKQSIEVMKNLPVCKKYVKGYEMYADDMIKRGIELLQPIPPHVENFSVLCHGDFWLNNIMFKYDTHGTPVDVIFVDFQMSTFGNPGLDLNYFFFTSPTIEARRGYRHTLLQQYVTVVADVLNKLHYDGMVPNERDLSRKLLEAKDIAIMTPGIVLPLVKLNQEDSQTITTDSLMKGSESKTGGGLYNNPVYQEALSDAIQYLVEICYITEACV